MEERICKQCERSFVIQPGDFSIYEKLRVPPPTWCPDCRLARKMCWRNERTLFRRTCDLCRQTIVSTYPADAIFPVYCQDCWWSDGWDPMSFGSPFDMSRPFFTQFKEGLLNRVPAMGMYNTTATNSDYCNFMSGARNCYLLFGGRESESVLYSNRIYMCKDGCDLYTNTKTEKCFECVQCENSYGLQYSQYCDSCSDSAFLYDCKNCMSCFGCTNLRGKQYYFFNQPLTKDEYLQKMSEIDMGSRNQLENIQKQFAELKSKSLNKYAQILKCEGSTGDNLKSCKNCRNCFDLAGTDYENCIYSHYVAIGLKDSADVYGLSRGELIYDSLALGFESTENARYVCSQLIKGSSEVYYSSNCSGSNNLFGCYGLRQKSYCILNKQYSKEEYEVLVPKIIQQMNDLPYTDKMGRLYPYGEFLPAELSPFAYSETIAQEYFPLSAGEAGRLGYRWEERDKNNYQITLLAKDIPDHIQDVDDSILQQIIECAHAVPPNPPTGGGGCNQQCVSAFRIIPQELAVYRERNIPLPRLCPNCRHYERLALRNPLKLWPRRCMGQGCENKFETPYAPDRPEIVYCEQCYNAEVA